MDGELTMGALEAAQPVEKLDGRVVMRREPASRAAERFRLLAARLEPLLDGGRRRIAVTSPLAGDGRSTVAVNLAIALGRRRKVALVEADFRAPSLHAALGLQPVHGLADVVAGRATVEQATYRLIDVDFLPAGVTTAPHAVVGAERLREVFAELAERYQAVIVDAPAALQFADVPTLVPALDGALMVVRIGRTKRAHLAHAAAAFPPGFVVGAVLAGVDG